MRDVKCSYCEEYRNEWCEKVIDSPHPDILRDCQYFHEAKTRWIPCSERMPRIEENPVLVSWMGLVNIGWYNPIDGWTTGTRFNVDEVDAWMPLPQPWKEGQ